MAPRKRPAASTISRPKAKAKTEPGPSSLSSGSSASEAPRPAASASASDGLPDPDSAELDEISARFWADSSDEAAGADAPPRTTTRSGSASGARNGPPPPMPVNLPGARPDAAAPAVAPIAVAPYMVGGRALPRPPGWDEVSRDDFRILAAIPVGVLMRYVLFVVDKGLQAGFCQASFACAQMWPAGCAPTFFLTVHATLHLADAWTLKVQSLHALTALHCSTPVCCSAWLVGSGSRSALLEAAGPDREYLQMPPPDHWAKNPGSEDPIPSKATLDDTEETEEVLVEEEAPSASSMAPVPRLAPKPKVRSQPLAVKPVKAKSMPKSRRTPMQVTAFPGPGLQATFLRESDLAEGRVVAVTTDAIQVHLKDGSYGELTVPGSFRKSFCSGDVVQQMEVVGMEPEQPILLALTRPALAVDGVDIDLSAMERPP
ncbi:unnamed protein product, partial [Symbiodinium sp. CCMP2456]